MTVFEVSLVFVLVFIVFVNTSKIYVTDHKYSATPCEGNDDCSDLGTNSTCSEDGFCICNSSKICIDRTGIVVTKVGLDCIHNNDCNIDEAECSGGKCACKTEHVASPSGKRCLKITYHRCLLDSHCQNINENSFCFDNDNNRVGRCKCIDGYELFSRNRTFFACLQGAGWEEPCEKNIQCYYILSTDAVCDGVCKCAEGAHRFTDGRCYRSIKLGDFCQTDGNCLLSDGTFGNCIDGRCDCKFDRQIPTEDAMSCVEARNLGEICDNNDQCSSIPNAVCRVSCRCGTGYALSRDGTRCLEVATAFFDPCEENAQCSEFLQGSLCSGGNCTCEEGHHGFGTRCTRSAGLGGTCSGMAECIRDERFSNVANCIDGTCQCLPGAVDEAIGCNSCRVYYNFSIICVCLLYLFTYFY